MRGRLSNLSSSYSFFTPISQVMRCFNCLYLEVKKSYKIVATWRFFLFSSKFKQDLMSLLMASLIWNTSNSQKNPNKPVKCYIINTQNSSIHQECYFTHQCHVTFLLIHTNILPLIPLELFLNYQYTVISFPLIQFLQVCTLMEHQTNIRELLCIFPIHLDLKENP